MRSRSWGSRSKTQASTNALYASVGIVLTVHLCVSSVEFRNEQPSAKWVEGDRSAFGIGLPALWDDPRLFLLAQKRDLHCHP